jgi:hypothetical protein
VIFLLVPLLIIWCGYVLPEWYNSTDTFFRPSSEDLDQLRSEPDVIDFARFELEKIYGKVDRDFSGNEEYEDKTKAERAEAVEEMQADPKAWLDRKLGSCYDSVASEYWGEKWSKRNPPITIGVTDVYQIRTNPEKWIKKYNKTSLADRWGIFLFFVVIPFFFLFPLGLSLLVKLRS